jgi:hypothetical protein
MSFNTLLSLAAILNLPKTILQFSIISHYRHVEAVLGELENAYENLRLKLTMLKQDACSMQ